MTNCLFFVIFVKRGLKKLFVCVACSLNELILKIVCAIARSSLLDRIGF
jgi:hypothetical protein